jgi:hypothetical protein
MSQTAGVPAGIQTQRFWEYESRTQVCSVMKLQRFWLLLGRVRFEFWAGPRLSWPRNLWLCCHSPSKWRNRQNQSTTASFCMLPNSWFTIRVTIWGYTVWVPSAANNNKQIKRMELRFQGPAAHQLKEPLVWTGQDNGWFSLPVFAVWIIEKSLSLPGNKP